MSGTATGVLAPQAAADRIIDFDIADAPPSLERIESSCCEGLAGARLNGGAVDLADGAQGMLAWLRATRDFTACGVPVEWRAGAGIGRIAPLLHHLAPPENVGDPVIAQWRRVHRYGLCFWRRGPDFLTIVDRRQEERAHHYLLEENGHQQVFSAASTVVARESLAKIDGQALTQLEEEGLVLSHDGWSLALPFRMRHWPVPFTAI